jgi:hypothetical protein
MSDAHLDDATWEQLAMNELSSPARAEALRHVMACERCRKIFRGLRELEDTARAQGLLPPELAAPNRKSRWIAVGAAVVAVAAVLVLVFVLRRPDDDRTLRGGDGSAIAVEIADRVRVGQRVRWAPVAGATAYRVELFADDGTPAWSDRTTANELAWPATPKPGVYRLRIEAVDGERVLARSQLIRVEAAP